MLCNAAINIANTESGKIAHVHTHNRQILGFSQIQSHTYVCMCAHVCIVHSYVLLCMCYERYHIVTFLKNLASANFELFSYTTSELAGQVEVCVIVNSLDNKTSTIRVYTSNSSARGMLP